LEAVVEDVSDRTAVESRVPPLATGSRRPDAHVRSDLAVSRALIRSAIAWDELWLWFTDGKPIMFI